MNHVLKFSLNLFPIFVSNMFWFFGPWGIWDLSSRTRIWTHTPFNHWTTMEVPDSISRKAIAESHRELWSYDGPPKWSQAVTRTAVPLYSHNAQCLHARHLCLRQLSSVEGDFWWGLSLKDWQLGVFWQAGAKVLQVWREVWVHTTGSSPLAAACSWKGMGSWLKIVLERYSK